MKTTKDVIEAAIKVGEEEIRKTEKKIEQSVIMDYFLEEYIINLQSQIAELKQSLQDVFEAHNKRAKI